MIGFFEYQYLKFKKSHLKNLVALARADGEFHDDERKFLEKMGLKYDLKPFQIQEIIDAKDVSEPKIPQEYHKKIAVLYDTVGMMLADGVIDDREMTFCKDMFKRFGFHASLIDDMIQAYKRGGVDDIDHWDEYVEQTRQFEILEGK